MAKLFCQRAGFCYAGTMRIFLWLSCGLLAVKAAGAELDFNFSDYPTGATPTNFTSVVAGGGTPGAWKIVADTVPSAFAPLTDLAPSTSQRGVLAQTSQDATDERFPIFVYDREIFRDFKFTARFKLVSGTVEQMAGLVFRFQNASNFYVVRASALGKNLRFYKVVNGVRSDPIGPTLDLAPGTWHTLAVQAEGNQFSLWLDDRLAMPPLNDNTFLEGKLGFWTKSDAVSYFTDAMVVYTPRIPVAQQLVNSVVEKQSRLLGLRIYALGTNGGTRVVASKDIGEIGRPGTDAELAAIQNGTVSYASEKNDKLVTLPLHDRNGEFVAAVRVKLKTFFGETQNNAVTRAMNILQLLEQSGLSADDLRN
jgi:hypothetical protein